MIHSFFKNTQASNRSTTYSPYFVQRQPQEQLPKNSHSLKYRRHKLILLLLAKATARQLKEAWQIVVSAQQRESTSLARMVALSDKNTALSIHLYFDRLKIAAARHKSTEKFLKSVGTLLQRLEKYKLKHSFGKLCLHSARSRGVIVKTFFERRDHQFAQKVQRLVRRHKKQGLRAMTEYARFVKSFSKLRVVNVIHSRFQKQLKHVAFSKISRFPLGRVGRSGVDREVKELKVQLQDMTVQLDNKNESIQRLEGELEQIKVEQSNASLGQHIGYGDSASRVSRKASFKSQSAKRIVRVDSENRSINESGEGLLLSDMSIGSLLGNLNRSRYGSTSKFDASCECTCGLKAKYLKYKGLNESLKNQLQIVKEELEVAKDLNEHFTTEIKQYLTEGAEGDVQRLKREQQLLIEERDQLRDKVFKYQKQISNLKSEFKFKMEEIYRKVRKGGL